jgi:dihydrodipicolinate reductase
MKTIIMGPAGKMGRQVAIDLIDMHDNLKLDAPSATAKQIAGILSEAPGDQEKEYTYGRKGLGRRKSGSIQLHSVRWVAWLDKSHLWMRKRKDGNISACLQHEHVCQRNE